MQIKTFCATLILASCGSIALADDLAHGSKATQVQLGETYGFGDLAYSKQGCTEPAFPQAPGSDEEIMRVKARMAEWAACFNGFANRLAAAMPAGKLIPADVMAQMSASEQQQARSLMEQAYAQLVSDGEKTKQQVFAAHDTWLARTTVWANVERRQKWEQVAKWQPTVERVRYQSYAQQREGTPINNTGNAR